MQMAGFMNFGQGTSDITGFYQDGREFAVVGLIQDDAASFVDITDPFNPFEVGRIGGTPSIWRDLKYWNRHVYIGTEAADGVKVVSVNDPDNPTLVHTITDFTNSHNIHMDADGYFQLRRLRYLHPRLRPWLPRGIPLHGRQPLPLLPQSGGLLPRLPSCFLPLY